METSNKDQSEELWVHLEEEARATLQMLCFCRDQLRGLGWVVHCPPPKDRDSLTVEVGSTGVRRTRWMTCAYFAEDGGDLWPTLPVAWREVSDV